MVNPKNKKDDCTKFQWSTAPARGFCQSTNKKPRVARGFCETMGRLLQGHAFKLNVYTPVLRTAFFGLVGGHRLRFTLA